uniref:Uncharacterized protein n=1 Tax=Picea glauca TaxID=3330 RepID=A0A117NHK5_PICGL|nr:hypothetical protein ABT39_MTgene4485 [Picea glauca]
MDPYASETGYTTPCLKVVVYSLALPRDLLYEPFYLYYHIFRPVKTSGQRKTKIMYSQ